MSFNGLSGTGGNLGYQLTRFLALDAGLGWALQNKPKVGLRLRFDFLRSNWSPCVAVGVAFVPGDRHERIRHFTNGSPYTFRFNPLLTAIGQVGVSFIAENSFTFLAGIGLCGRVTKKLPYTQVPEYTYQVASVMNQVAYESGPLWSVACGYSF